MFQLREAYTAQIIRPHLTAARSSVVRVGAESDVWVVVTTKMSSAEEKNNQAIPVGSTVRFTLQYGWRAGKTDNSNIIVARGTVVSPRTPILPDSYGVRFDEIVKSSELDPAVSLPVVGQVFLAAPWSISAVEKTGSPTSESITESYSMPDGSLPPAPIVSSTVVAPAELVGTEPPAKYPHDGVIFREETPPAPTGVSSMTYVAGGVILALVAMLFLVVR